MKPFRRKGTNAGWGCIFGTPFSCIQSIVFFKKVTKLKSILDYYLFYNAQNRVCLPNTLLPRIMFSIKLIMYPWVDCHTCLDGIRFNTPKFNSTVRVMTL